MPIWTIVCSEHLVTVFKLSLLFTLTGLIAVGSCNRRQHVHWNPTFAAKVLIVLYMNGRGTVVLAKEVCVTKQSAKGNCRHLIVALVLHVTNFWQK